MEITENYGKYGKIDTNEYTMENGKIDQNKIIKDIFTSHKKELPNLNVEEAYIKNLNFLKENDCYLIHEIKCKIFLNQNNTYDRNVYIDNYGRIVSLHCVLPSFVMFNDGKYSERGEGTYNKKRLSNTIIKNIKKIIIYNDVIFVSPYINVYDYINNLIIKITESENYDSKCNLTKEIEILQNKVIEIEKKLQNKEKELEKTNNDILSKNQLIESMKIQYKQLEEKNEKLNDPN